MEKSSQLLRCRCDGSGRTECVQKCGYVCAKLPVEFVGSMSPAAQRAWTEAQMKQVPGQHAGSDTVH